MANRAYLASSRTGELTKENYATGRLACDNFVGVLWPALFSIESIKYFKLANVDGDEFEVPYLSTAKVSALRFVDERSSVLDGALDQVGRAALGGLRAHVTSFDDHVILDATEIWMMIPDDFDSFLLESIRQVEAGDFGPLIEQIGLPDSTALEEYHFIGNDWIT